MSVTDAYERLRAANPVPEPSALRSHPAEVGVFLIDTQQRSREMETQTMSRVKKHPDPPRQRRWLVTVSAAVVIVAIGSLLAITQRGDDVAGSLNEVDELQVLEFEATATFDGSACIYDGPTEYPLDSRIDFTFVNETSDMEPGILIFEAPPRTTLQDVAEKGFLGIEGTVARYGPNPGQLDPGERLRVTIALDRVGTWVVSCSTAWGGEELPAALLTVSGP